MNKSGKKNKLNAYFEDTLFPKNLLEHWERKYPLTFSINERILEEFFKYPAKWEAQIRNVQDILESSLKQPIEIKKDFKNFLENGNIDELITSMTLGHIGQPLFESIVNHLKHIIKIEKTRGENNLQEQAKTLLQKIKKKFNHLINPNYKLISETPKNRLLESRLYDGLVEQWMEAAGKIENKYGFGSHEILKFKEVFPTNDHVLLLIKQRYDKELSKINKDKTRSSKILKARRAELKTDKTVLRQLKERKTPPDKSDQNQINELKASISENKENIKLLEEKEGHKEAKQKTINYFNKQTGIRIGTRNLSSLLSSANKLSEYERTKFKYLINNLKQEIDCKVQGQPFVFSPGIMSPIIIPDDIREKREKETDEHGVQIIDTEFDK